MYLATLQISRCVRTTLGTHIYLLSFEEVTPLTATESEVLND